MVWAAGYGAGRPLAYYMRAGIAALANGDDGSGPIDAVVQRWLGAGQLGWAQSPIG